MQSEAKKTLEAPLFQSATAAVQAIRRRELSSRGLTEMLLALAAVAITAASAQDDPQGEIIMTKSDPTDERPEPLRIWLLGGFSVSVW